MSSIIEIDQSGTLLVHLIITGDPSLFSGTEMRDDGYGGRIVPDLLGDLQHIIVDLSDISDHII
jgi:hypothetical protein